MSFSARIPQRQEAGLPAIDPLALYAAGIDGSDYVARVAPIVGTLARQIGDLSM